MIDTANVSLLHELFFLNKATGKLYWKQPASGRVVGKEAGYLCKDGYRAVWIEKKLKKTHRVVFAMSFGRWPKDEVDHINGVRDDNRPDNLREATNQENGRNQKLHVDSSSGRKGVSWHKRNNKWIARIVIAGKIYHLGYFTDIDAAQRAYEQRAEIMFKEYKRPI